MSRFAPLALAAAMAAPAQADEPPSIPQSSLRECAVIAAEAERLACYDRLAGRTAPTATGAEPAAGAPPVAAPPAPRRAATTRREAETPAATPPAPVESFGLYKAEHPAPPPVAPTLQARVMALGRSARGHQTVTVEGGGLWELEEADPMLVVGDTVTIGRAALGSFLMKTPAKRTHRVRRLR